jgi:hypothetical protein
MNAPIRTLRARPPASLAGLLLLVSTLAGVGGCADVHRAVSLPPVNPESPVAARVTELEARTYPRPSLYDIPPTPKNVPSAPLVKLGVVDMVRCRRAMYDYAAAHPQMTQGAETFAEAQRQVAQPPTGEALPTGATVNSEDLAARLRAFASPPSPIGAAQPAQPPAGQPPPGQPPAVGQPPAAGLAAAPPPAAAAPADVAASAQVDQTTGGEAGLQPPPLPPPGHDPLLARCT